MYRLLSALRPTSQTGMSSTTNTRTTLETFDSFQSKSVVKSPDSAVHGIHRGEVSFLYWATIQLLHIIYGRQGLKLKDSVHTSFVFSGHTDKMSPLFPASNKKNVAARSEGNGAYNYVLISLHVKTWGRSVSFIAIHRMIPDHSPEWKPPSYSSNRVNSDSIFPEIVYFNVNMLEHELTMAVFVTIAAAKCCS